MALYEDRFNPAKLKGSNLQQEVTNALTVLGQVETYLAKQPAGKLADFLTERSRGYCQLGRYAL